MSKQILAIGAIFFLIGLIILFANQSYLQEQFIAIFGLVLMILGFMAQLLYIIIDLTTRLTPSTKSENKQNE